MEMKIENKFTAEEFLDVIVDIGWNSKRGFSVSGLNMAILSSTQLYCVRNDNGKIIALARVLSDNYIFSTIPEIMVRTEEQGRGHGSALMKEIINDFGHTILFFGAQKGNEEFFEKFGFVKGVQSYTRHFTGFGI
ncbi:MAG TPA: GNAT family N-acetyltransferase [Bacteriovoracaceae bacterium]|nr:GNAT family N-acetyltransferase [Bacteriovoracaceae bacterium]